MSAKIQELVWDHSRADGSARCTLLLIAKFANADGIAWCPYQVIAEKVRINRRSAIRCVQALIKLGELKIINKGAGHHANTFQVTIKKASRSDTGDTARGDTGDTPGAPPPADRGDTGDTSEVTLATPQGCRTRHLRGVTGDTLNRDKGSIKGDKKNIAQSQCDRDFDVFWEIVPNKKDKKKARKAFEREVKIHGAEALINGMKKYAASVVGKERRYILHPTTWLNGERLNDELDPKTTRNDTGTAGNGTARAKGNSFAAAAHRVMSRGAAQP